VVEQCLASGQLLHHHDRALSALCARLLQRSHQSAGERAAAVDAGYQHLAIGESPLNCRSVVMAAFDIAYCATLADAAAVGSHCYMAATCPRQG
jgi:hypothetical protein